LTSNLPSKEKRIASVSANDSSATVRVMHRAMDKASGAVAEILVGAEKDSSIKTWHETTAGNEDILACIETRQGIFFPSAYHAEFVRLSEVLNMLLPTTTSRGVMARVHAGARLAAGHVPCQSKRFIVTLLFRAHFGSI
jgi:hypothetical protein